MPITRNKAIIDYGDLFEIQMKSEPYVTIESKFDFQNLLQSADTLMYRSNNKDDIFEKQESILKDNAFLKSVVIC